MLVAVGIWGSTFVVTKVALADMSPIVLATLRFAVAAGLLMPYSLSRGGFRSFPVSAIAVMGFLGVTMFYSLQNVGLYYTSAASAGLILGSIPVFTLVFSALFLREAVTPVRAAGVFCSVAGVSVIVLTGSPAESGPFPLAGNLLMLGSAISWAAYTVKGKALMREIPQHVVAAGSVTFGFLFLLPLALVEARLLGYGPVSASTWLAVGYLGFAASGVAFFLWNYGLKGVSASEAGTVTNLSPVVAVLTAALVLGETVGLAHLAGGAMVIGGVYLADLPQPRSRRRPSG